MAEKFGRVKWLLIEGGRYTPVKLWIGGFTDDGWTSGDPQVDTTTQIVILRQDEEWVEGLIKQRPYTNIEHKDSRLMVYIYVDCHCVLLLALLQLKTVSVRKSQVALFKN